MIEVGASNARSNRRPYPIGEPLSFKRNSRTTGDRMRDSLFFFFFNPPTLLVPPLSNKRKNEKASIPPTLFEETFKAF